MSSPAVMSLFIPHVFANFDANYIANAFRCVGDVERVDLVAKIDKQGKTYNSVYVHFTCWLNSYQALKIQKEIEQDGSSQFYYDKKWYWIVLPNTGKKHAGNGERKQTIQLEDGVVSVNRATLEKCSMNEDEVKKEAEEAEMLKELESAAEEADKHLIWVDGRYLKTLEEENQKLRLYILQLEKESLDQANWGNWKYEVDEFQLKALRNLYETVLPSIDV
jgi:hypothetical protein